MSDFSIDRGTNAQLDLVLTDSDNQPVNLTGAAVWFTVKRRYSDADAAAIMQKTVVGGGIVVDDAPGGLAHVLVVPADTADLGFYRQRYPFDIKVRTSSNRTEILDRGILTIEPTITDPE